MISKYYEILGISKESTLTEIKKAYRKKAKQLHPDVNKSADAHEEFVSLTEAYEYLQNFKSGNFFRKRNNNVKSNYNRKENLRKEQQKRARQRANMYAKMRYNDFINSKYYKATISLNIIWDFIEIITSLFIISGPLLGYYLNGITGLIIGVIIIIFTVQLWAKPLTSNFFNIDLKKLFKAILYIAKTSTFKLLILIIINFFIIFKICFNTLITIEKLSILYIVVILLGYFISKKIKIIRSKRVVFLGIVPLLINIFFTLNFLFSINELIETYNFKKDSDFLKNDSSTSVIILEGNNYSEYFGIRFFLEYDKMENSNSISYKFEEGLFGLRVMKSYKFN
jgi:hypothetical protein